MAKLCPITGEKVLYLTCLDCKEKICKEKGERKMLVKTVKERYPAGTRIRLIEMIDDPRPIEPGSMGTVTNVDDMGTVHVNWDNGRTLGLIPDFDIFEKI